MFSGMTDTQWLRRLRLNIAWVIVLRVANSISVGYVCIIYEYFYCILKLSRNFLFVCKVSSYFKEFVYFVVREFQRVPSYAQRIRNLIYSLGMNPILMDFTNCLVNHFFKINNAIPASFSKGFWIKFPFFLCSWQKYWIISSLEQG